MDGNAGALPASSGADDEPAAGGGAVQAASSGAAGDPYAGDGSLREGSRAPVAVTVRDPEVTGERPRDPEPARQTRNFCSNCGTRLGPDDRSCPQCGAGLD